MATKIVCPSSLNAWFLREAPDGFLENLALAFSNIYRESEKRVRSGFTDPEAQCLIPYVRRATAEQSIRMLSQAYSADGVTASAEVTQGRSSYYTVCRFSRFIFTESFVRGPARLPPRARFRDHLSLKNAGYEQVVPITNQYRLFEPNEELQSDDLIYAIVTHGCEPQRPGSLGFLRVGFPTSDFRRFIGEPIDLMNLTLPSSMETPEETIVDRALPVVRVRRKQSE